MTTTAPENSAGGGLVRKRPGLARENDEGPGIGQRDDGEDAVENEDGEEEDDIGSWFISW